MRPRSLTSASWRTRKSGGVIWFKSSEPGALMYRTGGNGCQLKQRNKFILLPFWSIPLLTNWTMLSHIQDGYLLHWVHQCNCQCLTEHSRRHIQKSCFTNEQAFLSPVKLTHKSNQHTGIQKVRASSLQPRVY